MHFGQKADGINKIGDTLWLSAKMVMAYPEHYGRVKLIKIGDYNVSKQEDVPMVPAYMTFALGKIESN